jgi:lipoyl(octanoyl) transferase
MNDALLAAHPAIRDIKPSDHLPAILQKTLGVVPYRATLERMRRVTDERDASSPDEIWVLQHPAVYTLGLAGRIEHLLDRSTSIAVEHVERGGQITYHGPGQVVGYTLIDLRRRGIKVREFVTLLEAALIDTLAAYNVRGQRRAGAPGIYVDVDGVLAKVAALGLKVKNGSTFHGVALNVAMDLSPFEKIDPCGYPGLRTVDLATLGVRADINDVGNQLSRALVDRIERKEGS